MFRSFCIILFFVLTVIFKVLAEEKQVNISVQNVPLSDVLNSITEQTGMRFSYNPQQIDAGKNISVSLQNKNLQESLNEILPASVSAKQYGKYIILSHTEETKVEKKGEDKLLNSSLEKNKLEKIPCPSTGVSFVDCHNDINLKNEQAMKKHLVAMSVLATTMAAVPAVAQESVQTENPIQQTQSDPARGENKTFQFSFVYPLGTDFINSKENTYEFSLNCIGGITGRVDGFEIGSVFNINKYNMRGAQFAGVFNMVGYDFVAKEESNALQFAGAFNFMSTGNATQFAGAANFTEKGTVQLAGGVNIGKEVDVQLSGGVNIADSSSCQIAVVNITRKGGFQLGVVNMRDTVDGFSVGLINIVKRGGLCDVGLEGGEFIHTALTFRSGTYRFYSIFSGGWNFTDNLLSAGFGLGTSFRLTNSLGLNLELMHHQIYETSWDWNTNPYNGLAQIRPLLDFRIARHFKIFAGPTANLLIQHRSGGSPYLSTPYKSLYNTQINDTKLDAWVGFTAGLRF